MSGHGGAGAVQKLASDSRVAAARCKQWPVDGVVLTSSVDCIQFIMPDGRIELINEAGLVAMELSSVDAIVGEQWASLWPDETRAAVLHAVAQAGAGQPSRFSGYCLTAQGAPRYWDVVVTPMLEDGIVTRLLAISRDITAIRSASQQFQWSSEHDALTGLPNRRAFEIKLQAGTLEAMASRSNLGLLLVDLDHFKHVNDRFGHQAGDYVLTNFGERLAASVRATDFVARLGGDEFAVILGRVRDEADLLRAGASILSRIQQSIPYENRMLSARASIGGALFPRDAASAHELFKNADAALVAMKAEGRGGTRVFHRGMHDQLQSAVSQISLARSAILANAIRPHYQPKVCLRTGKITGFEALLRFEQGNGTHVGPAAILAAFREYELASKLSELMQRSVLGDIAGWMRHSIPFSCVSINAAPAEFLGDDYAERLQALLVHFGVSPEKVEVEVTEQVFMERGGEYVIRALHQLHRLGVRISLDDFGTGHSSLSHLRDYPVDVVKIDRSIVESITTSPQMEAIVRAVSNLCDSLSLQLVAEGVETSQQAGRLLANGCVFGQGFLFGRPVPASDVPALLAGIPLGFPPVG